MLSAPDAYLALSLLPKIGPIRVKRLLAKFGSPQAIFTASQSELTCVPGIGAEMAKTILLWEQHIDLIEEKRRMAAHDVRLLTLDDPSYPELLRQIYDPPFLLFMRGALTRADEAALAVVGSRRLTHYGRDQARRLSYQLAKAGFTVVSGLARGIDTAAHEAALAAGGRTIAVLGSGVGNVYPPENAALADRIAENGAVLSEFPVLYVPDKQSFPLRNRIVAGMSRGLLVVEAPAWSGALITANQALEQGRSVYAIPGPIDRPSSAGCNRLIQQGAKLVCSAEDIIDDLGWEMNTLPLDFSGSATDHPVDLSPDSSNGSPNHAADPPHSASSGANRQLALSPLERKIMDQLDLGDATIDSLAEATSSGPGPLSVALLQLEIKHLVRQRAGKLFTKAG